MTIAANITAFHFLGGALALWAVVLAVLGVMRHDFPPKGAEKIVIGISALLVVSTIIAAITSGEQAKTHPVAASKSATGGEGSAPPRQGGTPAPGTGASAGQTPGGNAKPKKGQATSQTLTLSADAGGALKFDTTALQAKAGVVKLVLNNTAPVPHNISIEGPGGLKQEGPIVSKGGASQVSATLKAGTYTFYCAVPGHRQAGMQGSVTVK